jgi:Relaxase/Mobilisation nuclease domain
MIVKIWPSGRSFKFLAEYLTHDTDKAQTSERVAWTHTLNLANDHIPSAVDELYRVFEARELLKREAGVRPGGAKLEKPVKHVSLAWEPGDRLTREEMIAATESFLKAQGWQEHQCVVVAHSDTPHPHVHLMINMVHPERGTRLRDASEYRHAQKWALGYEISRGKVVCQERLKPEAEREKSPPRNAWEQLRHVQADGAAPAAAAYDHEFASQETQKPGWRGREWQRIKEHQKEQRLAFFAGGKRAYREVRHSVYSEVRVGYRREWRDFFALMRAGVDAETLAVVKADLVARQSATLRANCVGAARQLRQQRDASYRELLDRHKEHRTELINRQERGLTSPHLWTKPASVVGGLAPGKTELSPEAEAARERGGDRGPGLNWTGRAGLVAQQRAAMRWHDRVIAHANRDPPPRGPAPANPLAAAAAARLNREGGKKETGVAIGVEPDGTGGLG